MCVISDAVGPPQRLEDQHLRDELVEENEEDEENEENEEELSRSDLNSNKTEVNYVHISLTYCFIFLL